MANQAEWLKDFEKQHDEQVEYVLVGKHYNDSWSEGKDRRPEQLRNVLLGREVAMYLLDVEFDNGYGGADCFPLLAWTKNWVLFIGEYDGATQLQAVPRHPTIAMEPDFQ